MVCFQKVFVETTDPNTDFIRLMSVDVVTSILFHSVGYVIALFLFAFIFRLPSFLLAGLKGFIPFEFKGYMDIVITDVLIDESGKVIDALYGRDIGHHYSFDKIREFSQ